MRNICTVLRCAKYSIRLSTCRAISTIKCDLDYDFLCDPSNAETIRRNISIRKGVGDINLVHKLRDNLTRMGRDSEDYHSLNEQFQDECLRIPNRTHPEVAQYETEDPVIVRKMGSERIFTQKPLDFDEIAKKLNLVRTGQLGAVTGERSYFVLGQLALLEHALIQYTVGKLIKQNFKLVSVPDMLPRNAIESCGMTTRGERSQVYQLDKHKFNDICLSGTAEMAIARLLENRVFKEEELPAKFASVSRCYRAETSSTAEEKGIFRVHEFTKVEMFAVCRPQDSDSMLESIRQVEETSFAELGLHFQVLDMPPHELGASAYRKYDIEAWMPGRQLFGEVSSCSNCTDYQSRRLGIKYITAAAGGDGRLDFAHTLNGTACAIPRMLIALTETFQDEKGFVNVPNVLVPFMRGVTQIGRQKRIPEIKLIKNKNKI